MTLALHSCGPQGTLSETDLSATALPEGIVWIDLLLPTDDESAFIERQDIVLNRHRRSKGAVEFAVLEKHYRIITAY